MKRSYLGILLLAAILAGAWTLLTHQPLDAAPAAGGPFASSIEQRMEMSVQLKEMNAQLRELNAFLKSGNLRVVVVREEKKR